MGTQKKAPQKFHRNLMKIQKKSHRNTIDISQKSHRHPIVVVPQKPVWNSIGFPQETDENTIKIPQNSVFNPIVIRTIIIVITIMLNSDQCGDTLLCQVFSKNSGPVEMIEGATIVSSFFWLVFCICFCIFPTYFVIYY